jgi:threonine dehydrogenase-like Zn-dependent dehydrogenase
MADSIQGLRPDGRLVVMGVDTKPLSISPLDLVAKRIKIIGSQQNGREYLYEALALAASGKVRTMAETPVRRDREGLRAGRARQSPVPGGRDDVAGSTWMARGGAECNASRLCFF